MFSLSGMPSRIALASAFLATGIAVPFLASADPKPAISKSPTTKLSSSITATHGRRLPHLLDEIRGIQEPGEPRPQEARDLAGLDHRERGDLQIHRASEGRSRPRIEFVPGAPMTFPRQLLPHLLGEIHADIEEPGEPNATESHGDFAGSSLRGGLDLEHRRRSTIPINRLINNPNGQPPGSTQSENSIAALGRYVVAGWNESFDTVVPRSFSGFGYSSDGGKTWTDGGTLPHASTVDFTVGDPSLAVDDEGNFYYASLYTPDAQNLGVSVSRGRFRGQTFRFGPPVIASMPRDDEGGLDKEWLAADPKSGALYLTYTRFFLTGASQIELVRSRDRGRTWSEPVVISDTTTESTQGSRPVVGPNHEVYVVYAAVDLADFTYHMRIRKSTNQGRRFGSTVDIGERRGEAGISPNLVTGPPGFNRSSGVEFPSIAVDHGHGEGGGSVYVTWPEAIDWLNDPLGGAGVTFEAEANEVPANATPFTLGVTLVGNFVTPLDQDWYSFTGRAGQTVEFFITPPQGGQADGFLRLFCRNGETADRLAFSYFGAGQGFIVFTLPADGTYYLRALPINPAARTGDYYVFTGVHVPNERDVARDARDVVIARSKDGVRWNRRVRVNHDAPLYDNSFPEVAVDGRGDVHVVWYDHRNDRQFGILTDLFASVSSDGGRRFGPDRQVNDGPATNWNLVPSRLAPNMGDYIGLVSDGRRIYANWADGRLGSPDSWMAQIAGGTSDDDRDSDDEALAGETSAVEESGAIALRAANPVRLGAPVALHFELPLATDVELEIYSVTGQRVQRLASGRLEAGTHRLAWDARGRDGETVSPGVYFAVLRAGTEQITRRIALLP